MRDSDSMIFRNGNVSSARYLPGAETNCFLGTALSFTGRIEYGLTDRRI